MHLYEKRPVFKWKGIVVTVLVFVAIIGLLYGLLGRTESSADREQTVLLETAIRNAAVTHYAVEGRYPASLEQVKSEYGVIVDDNRFIVRYNVFASNIMPEISVVFKGENAK